MAKFVINMEEAIVAVRKQYGLPESVEIEIVESSVKTDDASLWHDVPSNWQHNYAPDETYYMSPIQVMYRNGDIGIGDVSYFHGDDWKQENSGYDIVKFRKAQI